jgi:hypothetical protein
MEVSSGSSGFVVRTKTEVLGEDVVAPHGQFGRR